MKTNIRRVGAALLATIAVVLTTATVILSGSTPSSAANASDFNPGNIISDSVFYDFGAFTPDQIQHFLDTMGASCVAGQQQCLRSYSTTSVTKAGENGLCYGFQGGQTLSAALVIAQVAFSCGINPKVLIVMLQKEQGLVTATRPTTTMYQSAMGQGCPDTAPCDAQYYGFFNQVYGAARQFKLYQKYPTSYGYIAGRTNNILFSPNQACGSAPVYIQNQATAALYIYTPYQPNASALANLYGTGDGCASYGNRNFWRYFTDWFGPTLGGSFLLRSVGNATVYVVTSATKFPIPDQATLQSLYPLGPVGYVSQAFLDRIPTGPAIGRVIVGPDGGVWFFDSGIRLHFDSCYEVVDYGSSCAQAIPLDSAQIALLVQGPPMPYVYNTTSGKSFFVQGGIRHEIADQQTLIDHGLATTSVTLQETGISMLPLGAPLLRDGIRFTSREGGDDYFIAAAGTTYQLPRVLGDGTAFRYRPVELLDRASLYQIVNPIRLGPLLKDGSNGLTYLLTPTAMYQVDAQTGGSTLLPVDHSLLADFGNWGPLPSPVVVRSSTSSIVYFIDNGRLRLLSSYSALQQLVGSATPGYVTMSPGVAELLAKGTAYFAPGSMVNASGQLTVYFADDSLLWPIASYYTAAEFGLRATVSVSPASVSSATIAPTVLQLMVTCGSQRYFAAGGSLHSLTAAAIAALATTTSLSLGPATCAQLPKSSSGLDRFIRTSDTRIYYLDAGSKRPIIDYSEYVTLGGNASNTLQVSDVAAAYFPTGSSI